MYQAFSGAPGQRRASELSIPSPEDVLAGELGSKKREEYVEGNLKIYHAIECKSFREGPREGKSDPMCVRFSPDGSLLAVGRVDGIINVYNPDTGQVLYSVMDEETQAMCLPVTSLRFKPHQEGDKIEHKNILMATYASGRVKFWHISSNQCLGTVVENRQTLAAAYNPQGATFVTTGANTQLYLYDASTKKKIRTMSASDSREIMSGHKSRVLAVMYHPLMPFVFVSGGWDDTVQFWDERQPRSSRSIYGPHICGDSIDIDAFHGHLLTGSWRKDNVLQIWDFNSGNLLKNVPQDTLHNSMLYCAQWLGKESIVCGGSQQNMARVLDRGTLNTVGQLVELQGGAYSIDNDRQGSKPRIALAAGTKVYIMKIEKNVTT